MTCTQPRELTHCYSLLFTGEAEQKKTNYLRAALCFEECRMTAEKAVTKNSIFAYALYRAARKEAQMLIFLDAKKRAFRMLNKLINQKILGGNSYDRLFIYSQLSFLAEKLSPSQTSNYKTRLNTELQKLVEAE